MFPHRNTETRVTRVQRAVMLVWLALCIPSVTLGQEVGSQSFVVYELQHKQVADVERLLKPLLPQDESVRIFADSGKNQLLVSAAPEVQRLVKNFLNSVDQPAANAVPQEPVIKMYRGQRDQLASVAEQLKRRFSQQGLRVSVDHENGALLVMASPAVHGQVARVLEAGRIEGDASNGQAEPRQANPQEIGTLTPVRRLIPIPRGAMETIYDETLALFRNRLEWDPNESDRFRIVTTSGAKLVVGLDRQRAALLVEGDQGLVRQFETLIDTLARNQFERNAKAKVLLLQREAQSQLQPLMPQKAEDLDQSNLRPRGIPARPIGFQEPDETEPAQGQPLVPQAPRPLGQFDGVQIDTLPDLDVIILRGREQELQQLSDIIRQLEEISRETQAEVSILPLQNVSSTRVAEIISETQEDLVGARQGRVSLTPLVKPNALLLIGWGEAVSAVIDLAKKLDRPVSPQTQFEVFRLKHASALQVDQTLQDFFDGREALGPLVQSTVDRRTNAIVVYAAPRDMAEVRALIARLDTPRGEMIKQVRVFPISNSLASDVAETLQQAISAASASETGTAVELLTLNAEGQRLMRSGILGDVQITVNPRNNTLIVTSPAENFELIQGLIEQLDTPGVIAKIKIYPVIHGDAASLVETLRSLIPSQPAGNTELQLSTAPGETNLAPLRFTVDVRSNSVIATGSEGDLRIVEMLIVRLDEGDSLQRKTKVYQLKNSPAADVALAVNEFLRNRRQVEEAGPGEANPFQQLEKEVVVVPEPVANKLILSATPRYFDEIEELIEKLDEQPPEVVIQVLIAEVALNNADEMGVELGIQDSVLFDRSLLGDLLTTTNSDQLGTPSGILTTTQEIIRAATNLPGFDFNTGQALGNSGSDDSLGTAGAVGGQGLSNFAVGRANDQLGFSGLVLSASSQNVSILIRALQENRRLEILSRPQVRTLDNQPAFIQVGQRVPRITASNVSVNGQTNQVVLENVGLILGVTPRISPEGTVVMEIDAEKSQLGPEAEGIPVSVSLDGTVVRSPRIDTTTAQATVSAADGETIILGGLITKSDQEVHRRVPWLGDLPVLNRLFRFDSVITRRTELLIILTPRVIRSAEDSERLKQTEMARMHWCAADVYDIQGDIEYMIDPTSLIPDGAQSEIIYPDQMPRGMSSRRNVPEEAPQPPPENRPELIPLSQTDWTPPVGGSADPFSGNRQAYDDFGPGQIQPAQFQSDATTRPLSIRPETNRISNRNIETRITSTEIQGDEIRIIAHHR